MPPHALLSLFDDATAWQVFASGQAEGKITASDAGCLRLDYNFHGGSGFIAMRREMDLTLPDTFTLGLKIRVRAHRITSNSKSPAQTIRTCGGISVRTSRCRKNGRPSP